MTKPVAVVTGAGRGLGRKIAERLGRRNIHVVCTDIDEGSARTTAAVVDGTGVGQDVRDPDSHREVARIARGIGDVTIWINNAGVLSVGETWKMDAAAVRRIVDVNLLGVIWGCHAALDVMQHGTILNVASLSALVPAPGLSVYAATKHAVLGYSLSLAGELRRASRPISVSTLCPDAIAGDMTGAVAHDRSAALLFSAGSLLTLERVAEEATALVDRPRLVRSIPGYRAALAYLLAPFPAIGIPLVAQLAKLGRKRQAR